MVVLRGKDAEAMYQTSMTHTIHRQAAFGIAAEVLRHEVVWKKGEKQAHARLTPLWVNPFVKETVDALITQGYVVYRTTKERFVLATPSTTDLMLAEGGGWSLTGKHMTGGWKLLFIDEPYLTTGQSGSMIGVHRSCAAAAMQSTTRYNELMETFKMRNFYNSRPGTFVTVSKDLKNEYSGTKPWFQSTASRDGAVNRTNVDESFSLLVQDRAATVRLLEENTVQHRERLTADAKPSVLKDQYADADSHHIEHVVTDGRDCVPVRQLLSLADGEHMLNDAKHDIFFAYKAPPQILGININSERTSINPRLNELVLDMFVASTSRIRAVIQQMFNDLPVAGATLVFDPVFSKHDCDRLKDILDPAASAEMYGTTYKIPKSMFNLKAFKLLQEEQHTTKPKSKSMTSGEKAVADAEAPVE